MPTRHSVLHRLVRARRRVLLHRRGLAALCAGAAVLVAVQAVAPAARPTTEVWTASRDLPGGTVLTASDLTRIAFDPASVPDDVVPDARSVLGRRLAAPLVRGEPITTVRTVGAGLLRGYPGTTAVPLRVADADVVDLLRVGDRVGFVLADPDGREPPQQLLDDTPVVALPRPRRTTLGAGSDAGRLVVVAVPSARAVDVVARAAGGVLVPVWSR